MYNIIIKVTVIKEDTFKIINNRAFNTRNHIPFHSSCRYNYSTIIIILTIL